MAFKNKSSNVITTLTSNPTYSRVIRYTINAEWTFTTNDLMSMIVVQASQTAASFSTTLLACAQIDRVVVWTSGTANTSLTMLGGEWGGDKEWTSVSNNTFPGHISVVPPRSTNASWMWKFRDLTWASPTSLFKVSGNFGANTYVDVHIRGQMHQGAATFYLSSSSLTSGVYYGITAASISPIGLPVTTVTGKTNV